MSKEVSETDEFENLAAQMIETNNEINNEINTKNKTKNKISSTNLANSESPQSKNSNNSYESYSNISDVSYENNNNNNNSNSNSNSNSNDWVNIKEQDDPNDTNDTNDSDSNSNDTSDNTFVSVNSNPEEKPKADYNKSLELKKCGNESFRKEKYNSAIEYYLQAIDYSPEDNKRHLSVLYSNIGACHQRLKEWEATIDACSDSISHDSTYIKPLFRRARAYEELKKYYSAQSDYKSVLELDNNHTLSREGIKRLEPLVKEQIEKQKEEVIDTLKTGANWLLNKFGMDINDFQLNKNSQGSYNVQYDPNKNPKRQNKQN